ncbi:signal transduction histidine kinase [Microbacterium endophyticum]|uniref:histidine kinase n=1 Tax=Microbacterium endophyticum TaxID=1526412 RepID=A0A7W4V1L4_9MICO|nr:sensor histidine kinase [Microbacterium endophyticum]MBB2975208.1 signal transduction histidine kinase [Microbacterium endophyticum]NIK37580.1 signal transduction histidine kinase [Microbacterium endophyticum]
MSRQRLASALLLLAISVALLGALQLALVLPGSGVPAVLTLFTIVSWVYAAAGIFAWWRRPANAMGMLIVIGGFATLIAGLGNARVAPLTTVGAIFSTTIFAVIVHLLLAFPSGGLDSPSAAATVIGAYVVALPMQLPYIFTSADSPEFAVASATQQIAGAAIMIATAVILTNRLMRAQPRARRMLLPLYSYGVIAVLAVPGTSLVLTALGLQDGVAIPVTQLIVLMGVPIAFTAGVLDGSFARTGEIIQLSEWLSTSDINRGPITDALAYTLGDSSVQLAFRVDNSDSYVDEHGTPLELHSDTHHRGRVAVTTNGREIAVIDYDTQLTARDDDVRRAGQVVAIAIDRTRLATELIAAQRDVVASRARLVDAADQERFRIAQNLHDGIQVQLVLLALEAQQIANSSATPRNVSMRATELRKRIDDAAGDLRRLVHDVVPLALLQRGLVAAVEDLVDRMPIATNLETAYEKPALTSTVENTAYFVIAEALANTVKHSGATSASVRIDSDTERVILEVKDNGRGGAVAGKRGLGGLADRVDALGGRFSIDSAPANGTQLIVELPCA